MKSTKFFELSTPTVSAGGTIYFWRGGLFDFQQQPSFRLPHGKKRVNPLSFSASSYIAVLRPLCILDVRKISSYIRDGILSTVQVICKNPAVLVMKTCCKVLTSCCKKGVDILLCRCLYPLLRC
jgi:hypothetical protein